MQKILLLAESLAVQKVDHFTATVTFAAEFVLDLDVESESYYTNSPSLSPMTIIRNYCIRVHVPHMVAAATI